MFCRNKELEELREKLQMNEVMLASATEELESNQSHDTMQKKVESIKNFLPTITKEASFINPFIKVNVPLTRSFAHQTLNGSDTIRPTLRARRLNVSSQTSFNFGSTSSPIGSLGNVNNTQTYASSALPHSIPSATTSILFPPIPTYPVITSCPTTTAIRFSSGSFTFANTNQSSSQSVANNQGVPFVFKSSDSQTMSNSFL